MTNQALNERLIALDRVITEVKLWGHVPRVLVVDDEADDRKLLQVMLAAESFEIEMASSGEDALERIRVRAPDLILLDVMMPGMDGFEVARRLRDDAATTNVPIIMITALDNRDARLTGLRAGADDILSKPIDRVELCVRARNLLRLKGYGDYYGRYSERLETEVRSCTAELRARAATSELQAAALHATEERTNFALGAAHMGIWELDLQTDKLTWSESMTTVFGIAEAPATGADFIALVHPDDQRMVLEAQQRRERQFGDVEIEYRTTLPDGAIRWIAARAHVANKPAGVPTRLLGVCTDISERRSLEAQLRQSQKMEAIGQLAGGVAHDFNNLLTAILGYAGFILNAVEDDPQVYGDVQEVIYAGRRAAALTGQLLAFSRRQVIQPRPIELNVLVDNMRGMLGRLIGEHIDLVNVLGQDLHVIRADPGQLEQVIMNLVINARDAMPTGGRLAIETSNVDLDGASDGDQTIPAGSYVMLAVTDDGDGMDAATRDRLFEPFFTTKETGKGTGLGLATVYGIVKQSDGWIRVESEPSRGASFRIYFPRLDASIGVAVTPAENSGATGTETVLLVEDDEPVRMLTSRILETAGYHVVSSPHPAHAAALFAEDSARYDLLVTDVIMPGSSGPRLHAALAKLRPDLRVLYVSGHPDTALGPRSHIEVDLLQKPFTAAALRTKVREVLDR